MAGLRYRNRMFGRMAYYCIVTDMTRPRPGTIMAHYDLMSESEPDENGSPVPDEVEESGTLGFQITIYELSDPQDPDSPFVPVVETLNQKRQRLKATVDDYFQRLIDDATNVDSRFDDLRNQAIGYRYPPLDPPE